MIEWFRQLGRASRNLGRIACQNPVWAVQRLVVDSHGSARFATDAEARDLTRDMGLLIRRDRKTGKLLRYPDLAHLLTIGLTRSGKGVSTIIPNLLDCIDLTGLSAAAAKSEFWGTASPLA